MWKKLNSSRIVHSDEIFTRLKTASNFYRNLCDISRPIRELTGERGPLQLNAFKKCYEGANCGARCFSTTYRCYDWRSHMGAEESRKVIPKLIYLHNPWKYLLTKYNLLKLRLLWDRDFAEKEFIRGSKQAAVVLTDIIRTQNTGKVSQFTTPLGFQQITRDMLLSRNDARLKLIKLDTEHLRRAIPIQVATRTNFGQKFCFIDMLFVGLRNTMDFGSPEEVFEIKEVLRQIDADMKTPMDVINVPHRIVFVEILIRFRRNYSTEAKEVVREDENRDWAVSFYKILTFDVLNYDPRG